MKRTYGKHRAGKKNRQAMAADVQAALIAINSSRKTFASFSSRQIPTHSFVVIPYLGKNF
jgi:hypothetical protein